MAQDHLPDEQRSTRRSILRGTVAAAGTLAAGGALRAPAQRSEPARCSLCLFSKPLHNRTFQQLPEILQHLDIDAVDLTVRPGGHVLPERVEEDLPAACELLREAGIRVPMITTAIVDAGEDHAAAIISVASRLGIRYAKLGYYRYGNLTRMADTLAEVAGKLKAVAALCGRYDIRAGFHNHSGNYVGAPLWDEWELLQPLPPDAIGSYFDIRHATVEGGDGGWRINMHRLTPRIVMLAVKDFIWQKTDKGWRAQNVPVGAGMVRLDESLRIAERAAFAGPVSLHMEYMHGGEHLPSIDSASDKANCAAIRKDWNVLKTAMKQRGML